MQKRSLKKTAAAALAACLLGGSVAYADNASHKFAATLPDLQQSTYLNSYQRASSTNSSIIIFSSIQNSQTVNVKAQNMQNNAEYLEIKGIGTGLDTTIPNSTPAGFESRLVLTNHDWNFLSPSVVGYQVIH